MQRYISLTEDDSDGGAGEGDIVNGNGPDYIDVYAVLGRQATKIEILLQEGTGGAGDLLILQLKPNFKKKMYKHEPYLQNTPLPQPWPVLSDSRTVELSMDPILIPAEAGSTVTWSYDGPAFSNLGIDLSIGGAAAVEKLTILIS